MASTGDETVELPAFSTYENYIGRNLAPLSRTVLPSRGAYPYDALEYTFGLDTAGEALLQGKEEKIFTSYTPNLNFSLDRIAKFETASPLVKDVLLLLYGSRESFVGAVGHPLEDYIFEFDRNLDSDTTVRAIGSAIGLFIDVDPNFFAYELFLDKLISCILQLEPKRINDVKYTGRPRLGDIINMDRNKFRQEAEKYSWEYSERLYQDRMNFYRFISLTQEEQEQEVAEYQEDMQEEAHSETEARVEEREGHDHAFVVPASAYSLLASTDKKPVLPTLERPLSALERPSSAYSARDNYSPGF
ncbi:hypothetical protein BQ9231_00032 [Cedratvirus lausannensis]|uniref:Uncharacterized protein n=1 Tax=Cedratvirus lausannensis TaxID=2023205 RepID=A0A285Q146_9VIRU|nr:hypothetical protein BQ9231_00032 [Cedratvirus lausannensis]